jgi:hypothetical protein
METQEFVEVEILEAQLKDSGSSSDNKSDELQPQD